jgi:hypothetical protein
MDRFSPLDADERVTPVDFDACTAPKPAAGDFTCKVPDCASSFGLVKDCTCTPARR